jgi:hypothetical protein
MRRKIQQSSLGKLIGAFRKEATAFGLRFQKIRVHGKIPTQQPIEFSHSGLARSTWKRRY